MFDREPTTLAQLQEPLYLKFQEWRIRDWYDGYPPDRPSPYWFALATDAVWMALSLLERIAYAVENPSKPKIGTLPAETEEPPPEPVE